jgi:hypothetical protein
VPTLQGTNQHWKAFASVNGAELLAEIQSLMKGVSAAISP